MEKKPAEKPKKEEAPKEKAAEKPKKDADDDWIPPQESIKFPDPKENIQATPEILAEHLKRTGGT